MAKERSEVAKADQWNVEAMYASLDEWEKAFSELLASSTKELRFPKLATYQGRLSESPEILKEFFDYEEELSRTLTKLYVYAHLRHDEDVTNEPCKSAYDRITLTLYELDRESSWVQPEILAFSDEIFEKFLKSEVLKDYRRILEKSRRLKPHTLSADKEKILALAGQPLEAATKAFGAFNNADLKFAPAKDGKGKEQEVTHGLYSLFLQSPDRELRKNAFFSMFKAYESYENTVTELLNGVVQNHLFSARVRNYPSCLEAALFPHQIDPDVYHNLVKTVRDHTKSLQSYTKMRKKVLGYESLHFYDLYVPLISGFDRHYSFDEANQLVLDSIHPLGDEYTSILKRGLLEERWVDRYENARKRSGAYSSGCYDSYPYILMNFKGILRDVMTLTHEAGHSMHSFYSNKHQPHQYSHYPIFVAEVASTFNEELLFRHLLEKAESKDERLYLLNQKIEDIRATLFRQTMFAEFELTIHQMAEEGKPLLPGPLKEAYKKLYKDYYGEEITYDETVSVEYLRIPHFYYNFYVYQYATGISAAYALAEKVLQEGEPARKAYLKFLSSGSSAFPLELLSDAGVDMKDKKPIESLIHRFDELVVEFEKEVNNR